MLFLVASLLTFAAAAIDVSLNITSFNVLAEMWLGALTNNGRFLKWYRGIELGLFDKSRRVVGQLDYLFDTVDEQQIIALQEITAFDFNMTSRLYNNKYAGFWAQNDRTYWADQVVGQRVWEPNGVAVFVLKSAFNQINFRDLALSNSGNHGVRFEGLHVASGRTLRLINAHYDDATDSVREKEGKAAADAFDANKAGKIDLLVGDMNSGVKSAITGVQRQLFTYFFSKNFTDVATALGKAAVNTHPWAPYVDADRPDGYPAYDPCIDHIVVRGEVTAQKYAVRDFNTPAEPDENTRIATAVDKGGSDHFSVRATLTIRGV